MNERNLYITSKATTDLAEAKKAEEKQRMLARIEKDKAQRVKRMAKQEQQLAYRSEKKAIFREAKDADGLVEVCCIGLEEALKLRGDAKATIEGAETVLKELERKRAAAALRRNKAQDHFERLEVEIAHAHEALDSARAPTDPSIMELKHGRLAEALAIANAAWDKVQKAIRKKERDRSIKSWAKKLLG